MTPELDTSVLAVAGKAKALIALNKRPEAEKLFQETLDRLVSEIDTDSPPRY
jgi:hypothetical protein